MTTLHEEESPGPGNDANGDLLRFVIDSSSEGLILLDAKMRVIDANPAAADMIGFPLEKLVGMESLDSHLEKISEDGSVIPKGEWPSIMALQSGAAQRGRVIGLRARQGKETVWAEIGAVPGGARLEGRPSLVLMTLKDITETKRAEERLSRKVRVLNAINDYSIRLADAPLEDMHSLIVGLSRSIFGADAAAIAGYDPAKKALILQEFDWSDEKARGIRKLIGHANVKGLVAPVEDAEYRKMIELQVGVASNLHEFSFGKVPLPISDAIERTLGIGWFRGLVLAFQGELFGGLGIAGAKGREAPDMDELRVFAEITSNAIKRKQAESKVKGLLEEKELILHEVHHRVKNNMNTMISLLSLQSRSIKGKETLDALQDAISRLQSMNTLYDKLFRAEDLREMPLKDYLPALVREIVAIFPNEGIIDVEAKIDDIRLDIKKLSTLGIIVNEIVTNSMKYAFPDKESGTIFIAARLRGSRIVLEVGDDGIGLPDSVLLSSPEGDGGPVGFGRSLVRLLAKQMDASVRVERRKGTRFVFEFERA